MQSYDPNAGLDMLKDIPSDDKKKIPTGLLPNDSENKVDQSQMADFSTPIEEVMAGPGQLLQDEVMGPPQMMSGNKRTSKSDSGHSGKKAKNPFGLTDEQFLAALAGLVAIIAYSKPVQTKLVSMVPKFLTPEGDMSVTGMAVTALIAAAIFYFGRQFIEKQ
jgi:hypothetical protein